MIKTCWGYLLNLPGSFIKLVGCCLSNLLGLFINSWGDWSFCFYQTFWGYWPLFSGQNFCCDFVPNVELFEKCLTILCMCGIARIDKFARKGVNVIRYGDHCWRVFVFYSSDRAWIMLFYSYRYSGPMVALMAHKQCCTCCSFNCSIIIAINIPRNNSTHLIRHRIGLRIITMRDGQLYQSGNKWPLKIICERGSLWSCCGCCCWCPSIFVITRGWTTSYNQCLAMFPKCDALEFVHSDSPRFLQNFGTIFAGFWMIPTNPEQTQNGTILAHVDK